MRDVLEVVAMTLLAAALWVGSILAALFAVALPGVLIGALGYGVYLGFAGLRYLVGV